MLLALIRQTREIRKMDSLENQKIERQRREAEKLAKKSQSLIETCSEKVNAYVESVTTSADLVKTLNEAHGGSLAARHFDFNGWGSRAGQISGPSAGVSRYHSKA